MKQTFLNSYFCNITDRLGLDNHIDPFSYPKIDSDINDMYGHLESTFDLTEFPITPDELEHIVMDIDISKSSSVAGIGTFICKDIMKMLSLETVFLFNCSIQSGIFPTEWAKGTVSVIPKCGNPTDPSNWRPITQTPIFAKILEKFVHRCILSYFDANTILTDYQYGFRPKRSTQEAVFDLTKFIYSGLNNKKLISTICLDVCKAFDCINHDLLLYKMRKIGFNDITISWFKSYLSRTQTVKFKDSLADVLSVRSGIGQGTILGPLIFIFYINDLVSDIGKFKINMYADDCILFMSGNNWNHMYGKVQMDLDKVNEWFLRNKLKLNEKKSKVLLFGSISKLKIVDYSKIVHIGEENLDFVDKYKYLGITLDKYMNLTSLICDVKKNVLFQLFKLRKLRRLITTFCAVSIYKQTILPLFDYSGFLLHSINASDCYDLQVIQNDALRTCYNVRLRDRLSVKKLHAEAKLSSLDQRRIVQLLLLMYNHKARHNVRRPVVRLTRNAERYTFHTERYNNVKYKNSPYYKGSTIWDTLPRAIVDCDNVFEFKKSVKKNLFTLIANCMYCILTGRPGETLM